MPYATMLTDGIECTYDLHSNLFKAYPEGKDDPDAKYAYKDMIVMLSQRVADWICKRIGDEDSITWQEIDQLHNYIQ